MSVYEKGLITILGLQALFLVLAIPLVLRKVRRNRVYGFRTCATLRDDRTWYETNAYFGRLMIVSSVGASSATPPAPRSRARRSSLTFSASSQQLATSIARVRYPGGPCFGG